MDPNSMAAVPPSLDYAQWEELQRECHPFSAYVDYIYGKDTAQQTQAPQPIRHFQLRRNRVLSVGSVQSIPSPCPTRPSLGTRIAYRVESNRPRDVSSQTAPGLQQIASPLVKAPTAMYMVKRDELLDPKFKDISLDWRHDMNDRIHALYDVLENEHHPYPERIQARDTIVKISTAVSSKAAELTKVETTLQNIHKELPRVYEALQMRSKVPPGHPGSELAATYLRDITKCLNDSAKGYVRRILKVMFEADQRGQDPLEAIPGHSKPSGVRRKAGRKRGRPSRK